MNQFSPTGHLTNSKLSRATHLKSEVLSHVILAVASCLGDAIDRDAVDRAPALIVCMGHMTGKVGMIIKGIRRLCACVREYVRACVPLLPQRWTRNGGFRIIPC